MSELLRIKPYSGRWQTIGPEGDWSYVSIQNSEATANSWGPDTLSFDLVSEPGKRRPDLFPYTPIEYLVNGDLVWAGLITSRLDTGTGFSVDCRGYQYTLDYDQFEKTYVQASLSDWQDARAVPGALLGHLEYVTNGTTTWNANNEAEVGTAPAGGLYFMWPQDTIIYFGERAGVILDLGPNSTCKRIVVSWASSNTTANVSMKCQAQAGPPFGSTETADLGFTVVNNSAASGISSATFTTPRRYVSIYMQETNAANYYTSKDIFFYLTYVRVFGATAYEALNLSTLKADQVIKDALTLAPLLNTSTALIAAGGYALPEYRTDGYKTPRQVMEAVNAYENKQLRIAGNDLKTLEYRVKPTNPLYEVGEWSGGATLNDSAISGDDIYNKVIVEATDPQGTPVFVTRTQTGTLVRGYNRSSVLSVSSGLATADANRLGDLWLAEHQKAPFSGTLNVSGTAIRRIRAGGTVPAHLLLKATGEKIRFSHRIDPDSGAQGRDGRIQAVRYRYADDSVEIAIDDRRDDFASALARAQT